MTWLVIYLGVDLLCGLVGFIVGSLLIMVAAGHKGVGVGMAVSRFGARLLSPFFQLLSSPLNLVFYPVWFKRWLAKRSQTQSSEKPVGVLRQAIGGPVLIILVAAVAAVEILLWPLDILWYALKDPQAFSTATSTGKQQQESQAPETQTVAQKERREAGAAARAQVMRAARARHQRLRALRADAPPQDE